MKIFFSIIFTFFTLTGCVTLNSPLEIISDFNQSFGLSPGPTLDAKPTPEYCSTAACKQLDSIENQGYIWARSGQLKWTKFVDFFYSERAKLFSPSLDGPRERSLISFHRLLAEQRDAGKISEAQWEYLINKKYKDLDDADAIISNTRQKTNTCTTTRFGNEYTTTCR